MIENDDGLQYVGSLWGILLEWNIYMRPKMGVLGHIMLIKEADANAKWWMLIHIPQLSQSSILNYTTQYVGNLYRRV